MATLEEGREYGRQSQRRLKYGITPSQFDWMLKDQSGRCAICWKIMDRPCIDHDHETGYVRGLLCVTCNAGLGCFKDDTKLLARAIVYLEHSEE